MNIINTNFCITGNEYNRFQFRKIINPSSIDIEYIKLESYFFRELVYYLVDNVPKIGTLISLGGDEIPQNEVSKLSVNIVPFGAGMAHKTDRVAANKIRKFPPVTEALIKCAMNSDYRELYENMKPEYNIKLWTVVCVGVLYNVTVNPQYENIDQNEINNLVNSLPPTDIEKHVDLIVSTLFNVHHATINTLTLLEHKLTQNKEISNVNATLSSIKSESSSMSLQNENTPKKRMKKYTCFCGKMWKSLYALGRHQSMYHPHVVVCYYCGERFSSKNNRNTHLEFCGIKNDANDCCTDDGGNVTTNNIVGTYTPKIETKYYRFICSYCKMKYLSMKAFVAHSNGWHKNLPRLLDCPECDADQTIAFNRIEDFEEHVQGAHEKQASQIRIAVTTEKTTSPSVPCKFCNEMVDGYHRLRNHYEENHDQFATKCKFCGKHFFGEYNVRNHESICDFNPKIFNGETDNKTAGAILNLQVSNGD